MEQQFGHPGVWIFALVITMAYYLLTYMLARKKKPAGFDVLDALDMSFLQKVKLRLRILETNYGRDGGWFVEYEGRRVALLTDPWFADMFWDSYHLTVLSDSPGEREAILNSTAFWRESPLVYKSRIFSLEAAFAISAGLDTDGRVSMRGLYLPVRWQFLGELIVWLRRRFSAKQQV